MTVCPWKHASPSELGFGFGTSTVSEEYWPVDRRGIWLVSGKFGAVTVFKFSFAWE